MRAMPCLLLLAALLAAGCAQEKPDSSRADVRASGSTSVQRAAEIAPRTVVAEGEPADPFASATASTTETSSPAASLGASLNDDSSLLHPSQVVAAPKTKRASRSAIVATTAKTAADPAESTAAPAPGAASSKSLPAISMHECELFHNHRDGVANEVTILYGTDRDRVDRSPIVAKLWAALFSSVAGSFAVTIGFACVAIFASRKRLFIAASIGSGLFTLFLGYPIVADLSTMNLKLGERKPGYGVGRGDLQLGLCQISVPPVHTPGRVEAPLLLSLDVIPDAERHFLLTEIEPLSDEPFYVELRRQVAASPKKDLFVFIHGYNVTFEAAALRTAQMKTDLEFQGAACFYSWPSQGGLLQYTRDEENVRYTITHLRQFLNSLTQQSGAKSIHLIAHSMGNRAMTDVLKEMRLELGKDQSKLFNQVVLAAPDVDAQVFMNDLAPRIRDTAERVTLYASNSDRALLASKFVHGYQRAGDSGDRLVVIDGVETVDVSGVDCSLLGHSYYGDSTSVLTDLALVLRGKKPSLERTWLTPDQFQGHTYWKFSEKAFATAMSLAQPVR